MKQTQLLFLVLTWLSCVTLTNAQSLTIETNPTDLPDELSSMALLGSSGNGRYLYGALRGRGFALDRRQTSTPSMATRRPLARLSAYLLTAGLSCRQHRLASSLDYLMGLY